VVSPVRVRVSPLRKGCKTRIVVSGVAGLQIGPDAPVGLFGPFRAFSAPGVEQHRGRAADDVTEHALGPRGVLVGVPNAVARARRSSGGRGVRSAPGRRACSSGNASHRGAGTIRGPRQRNSSGAKVFPQRQQVRAGRSDSGGMTHGPAMGQHDTNTCSPCAILGIHRRGGVGCGLPRSVCQWRARGTSGTYSCLACE
jgi:hypothetical protein